MPCCNTVPTADERDRIRELYRVCRGRHPADRGPPTAGRVGERATAVTDIGQARLIQCRDAGTAALLAKDPATAPHCVRAGERLICVPEQKLTAFRKGLATLGLVLPETSRG